MHQKHGGIANLNRVKNLSIRRLVMQDTGTYNAQFLRPYETNLTASALNTVIERTVQTKANRVDSNIFNDVVSDMITPAAAPEAMANITNNWDTRRIRFMLEVEAEYAAVSSTKTKIYVMGYTSFSGVTATGSVAPDMVFFVNNIIQTRTTPILTPTGTVNVEVPKDASQVICDNTPNGQNIWMPNAERTIRPEDVFAYMEHSHVPTDYMSSQGIMETRGLVTSQAAKSSRSNNVGQRYLSSLLNGYMAANNEVALMGVNELELLTRARTHVYNDPAGRDPFLSAINAIRGGVVGNTFTYADLQRLDPNVNHVTNYNYLGQAELAQFHQTGQTQHWEGRDAYTRAATIAAQAVPAIMMELMIGRISVHSTNYDQLGQTHTRIVSGQGFSEMDMTSYFNQFIARFEAEVVRNITYNYQTSYSLRVTSDVLGETWIQVSLNGEEAVDFVVPSFCDNLFAPVVTMSPQTPLNISNFTEGLVSNVVEALQGQQNVSLTYN